VRVVFWAAVGLVLYAYLGYPLLLALIGALRPRRVRRGPVTDVVSVIIAAHNEERRIRGKLENTLAQGYDRDELDVIVASDCSTDGTDEIVRSFAPMGVRLVRSPERTGKEAAQRRAIGAARGEILIFSDVGTTLPPGGIRELVKSFADPSVGCVSSVDRVIDRSGRVSGEGAYVRYEMLLRRLETTAGSVVGLSGSLFAARRTVTRPWPVDVPSDFNTVLNSVRLGLRGVSDPESRGDYTTVDSDSKEFERKVRTVVRGIAAVARNRQLLNPLRYGLFAWQLWSHKVCRWLVPLFLLLALVSNGALIGEPAYLALFLAQIGFYGAACLGIRARRLERTRLLRVPAFLILANASIVSAWYRYACGRRVVSWSPSERAP
jgi:glycosyltransferase involved in cell wall biosynthesis